MYGRRFKGGPRFVTVGEQSKTAKNSMTFFMDGPYCASIEFILKQGSFNFSCFLSKSLIHQPATFDLCTEMQAMYG